MTQNMTGGHAVVRSLLKLGVDTIFALPGVQNDWFFNAVYDLQPSLRVIHTRHEQGAAYMAMGYSQATDKIGVYSVVPGPGVLNTTGALSTAYAVNAKVLCLTGQINSDAIGKEIGLLHEIPDQLGVIERLTKWATRIDTPEEAPGLVTEAFSQMLSGRPRPTGIEIPMDILARVADVDLTGVEPEVNNPEVNMDAVKEAARLIGNAKNPVICVGGGAQHASAEVKALAEMLQAPIIPGRSGRGVVSSEHPLSLTTPMGYKFWGEADVVIGIGSRMYQQLNRWGHDEDLKVVRIDLDPSEHDKIQPAAVKLTSDSKATVTALLNEIPAHNRSRADRTEEMWAHRGVMETQFSKLQPQYEIAKALRDALPREGVFVDEVTQMGFTSRFMLPIYNPRSYISTGYQGTLGFGYATALGVKVGLPDTPVLNINGDGGFMFTVQEMSSAMRHGINLVSVVFADKAFGNVRRMQKENYDGRVIASDLHNPDFVKLAESFGMMGLRAHTPDELRKAITKGFEADAPVLIEMPVEEMPSPWTHIFAPPNRGV